MAQRRSGSSNAQPGEPPSAGRSGLWSSDDLEAWSTALENYSQVVVRQGISDLTALDYWYHERLPALVQTRIPLALELSELVNVVRWKMKRGVWRPRNLALVMDNPDDLVRRQTSLAFAQVPDPRQPIETIAGLRGVGPATASAVLAAYRPDLYPFLDDLVASCIPELGEPRFTVSFYLRYAAALRERAQRLESGWTAQTVGLALWSAAGGKVAAT